MKRSPTTWFIDFRNGDDSKDGLTPETAFRTPEMIQCYAMAVTEELYFGLPEGSQDE
jgi:hypothetical protein